MSYRRYSDGAYKDIENVRRYSDGAWADCDTVKRYADGAWVIVWEKTPAFKFGWIATTNPNGPSPLYVYEPDDDSCHVHLDRNDSTLNYRADIGLQLRLAEKLEAGSRNTISLVLSNVTTNVAEGNRGFVLNQANDSGLFETVRNLGLTNGTKSLTWEIPDAGVSIINFVIQIYGGTSSYADLEISNVKLNGVSYKFK